MKKTTSTEADHYYTQSELHQLVVTADHLSGALRTLANLVDHHGLNTTVTSLRYDTFDDAVAIVALIEEEA